MNQILITNNNFSNKIYYKNITKKIMYIFIFYFSLIIIFSILYNFINSYFIRLNHYKKNIILKNKYNINTLYPSYNNYTELKLSNNISIIGLIEIPSIDISYPIIKNTTEELLKISVCKFYGPLPNRIGNLCIVGHNYKNSSMFSNLNLLNIGDSIYITDLNNTKIEYIIYDKFKVKENNLECIQDTTNIEITLITCNKLNNNERIVVKAKMKGS